MNSSPLPITTPAVPAASTASAAPAATSIAGATAVPVDAALIAAETAASREFVAMLAQLMGEGAEVVAAAQPATPEIIDAEDPAIPCETLPEDVVLADPAIAALLAPQAPVSPKPLQNGRPSSDSVAGNVATILQAAKNSAPAVAVDVMSEGFDAADLGTALTESTRDAVARLPLEVGERTFEGLLDGATPQLQGASNTHSHAKPVLHIDARVGSPAWSDQLAARVSFLNERGIQSASLRLSPEHLGPMEIQITVKDDRASVWFGATHAETRTALEQALPRLRELLQSQGLSLADAGVFREPPREHSQDPSRAYRVNDPTLGESAETGTVVVSLNRASLVDAYA